jgi:hypothetical protein
MLQNEMIVLSGLDSLIITSKDGAPDNEYRILQSSVEFRALQSGRKTDGQLNDSRLNSEWRTLDRDEIQLHFVLHTPVADWLDKNLYGSSLAA